MAETTYKKGELLFNESVVTSLAYNFAVGTCQTQMFLNQEVLIIDFNGIEYECEANNYESQYIYGGFNSTTTTPDFSIYPFVINNMVSGSSPEDVVITDTINLLTENPGTYSLKVYTAIPDSDSDSSSESITIRSYIDRNLPNLNWNILPQIFESEGVELTEEIKRYLRETPKNTNWNIFKDVVKNNSSWITVFKGEIETSILYSSMSGELIGGEFSYQNLVIIPTDTTNIKLTVNSKVYELPLSSVPAQAGYTGSSAYVLDRYYGSDERLSNKMPDMEYGSLPYGIGCMFVNSQLALSLFINNEIGTYSVKVEIPKV